MKKLNKTSLIGLVIVMIFSGCNKNENLPVLDTSLDVRLVKSPLLIRNSSYESNIGNDNPFLKNQYPDFDYSQIDVLPVFDNLLIDREQFEVEKYKSKIYELCDYFGLTHFNNCDIDENLKFIRMNYNNDPDGFNEFFRNPTHAEFHFDRENCSFIFPNEIEDSLNFFDDDRSDSAKNSLIKLKDDIQDKFSLLFPCRYELRSPFYFQNIEETGIALNFQKENPSNEKTKLMDYFLLTSFYSIKVTIAEFSIYYYSNDSILLGEYKLITSEEAAERLQVGENEKLALMYIYSEEGERTLLRPVYTKYVTQSDLMYFLRGNTYIDAVAYN